MEYDVILSGTKSALRFSPEQNILIPGKEAPIGILFLKQEKNVTFTLVEKWYSINLDTQKSLAFASHQL